VECVTKGGGQTKKNQGPVKLEERVSKETPGNTGQKKTAASSCDVPGTTKDGNEKRISSKGGKVKRANAKGIKKKGQS